MCDDGVDNGLGCIVVVGIHTVYCRFKEDVYVMKDPFSAGGRDRPSTAYLLLGANCCICGATVCSDLQVCSI
jgi:hypothetical protein